MESTGTALEHPLVESDVPKNRTIRPLTAAEKLRGLLTKKDSILLCPGVYDGLTARIALQAGFNCLYMVSLFDCFQPVEVFLDIDPNINILHLKTGAGTAMSRLGMPDLGLATLNDMRENAAMIASLDRNIPLVADADTGFGGTYPPPSPHHPSPLPSGLNNWQRYARTLASRKQVTGPDIPN